MSGTKSGSLKTKQTRIAKLGEAGYIRSMKNIGSIGGSRKVAKGFAYTDPRSAGAIGGSRSKRRKTITDEEMLKARELRRQGMFLHEIVKELGYSTATFSWVCKDVEKG